MEHNDSSGASEPPRALAEELAALEHELEAGRTVRAALRERHMKMLGQLKSERAYATDLAWELEELEQNVRDLLAQREGPPDPLLERELASLVRRRAALEESALQQMLQMDELVARCLADEQALAEHERKWAVQESQLIAERKRIVELLARGNR